MMVYNILWFYFSCIEYGVAFVIRSNASQMGERFYVQSAIVSKALTKMHFIEKKFYVMIQASLNFVSISLIDNKSALAEVMA